jgi:4-hydroxybenzoate polyprenyltransferase
VSINKATLTYGLTRSTLQDRIKGSTTSEEAQETRQKLSKIQEKRLHDWIIIQADLGCPVSHHQVRDFASKVAIHNGFPDGVGKNWLQAFLTRWPDIKTLRGKRIDSDRFNGASTDITKAFFMLLMMPAVRIVKQKNRWNVDEVGMMEGIGMNGLVLGSREKKSVLIKQPGSRSWITILEAISADGRVLPPTVIFKGKTIQQQHFPQNLDFLNDWNFTCSEKGWTNNEIALIWLKTVFIPLTRPDNPKEPRLLILDGHGSHMTEEFLFECYENNIFLLFLPAHASHVLQPLDVAVFGPLKYFYRRFISDLAIIADTSQVGKISFLYNYYKARQEAITKSNACAGFKATGLWPVNVAKVLMNPMVTQTPIPATTPISHTND